MQIIVPLAIACPGGIIVLFVIWLLRRTKVKERRCECGSKTTRHYQMFPTSKELSIDISGPFGWFRRVFFRRFEHSFDVFDVCQDDREVGGCKKVTFRRGDIGHFSLFALGWKRIFHYKAFIPNLTLYARSGLDGRRPWLAVYLSQIRQPIPPPNFQVTVSEPELPPPRKPGSPPRALSFFRERRVASTGWRSSWRQN